MFVWTIRLSCPSNKPHAHPIKKYFSTFEHSRGFFKGHSMNVSNMSNV
jgi:hypothetical protein